MILLLPLFYITNLLYKKESEYYEQQIVNLNKNEKILKERLSDSFQYIGSLNVQLQELESIFTSIDKYPTSWQEMKKTLKYLTEKILSLTNVEWVFLRILDIADIRTLSEVCIFRDQSKMNIINISSNDLIGKKIFDDYSVISSTDKTFIINTFCIIPTKTINREQRIIIEAIVNQAEMLFIIFYHSKNFKNQK